MKTESVRLCDCYDRWHALSAKLTAEMDNVANFEDEDNTGEKEAFNYFLRSGTNYCLFAIDNGNDIGYILYTDNDSRIGVKGLYVLPDYRSKGVGKELMNQVKAEAGNRDIHLGVVGGNERALKFYLDNGFKISQYNMKYKEE